MQFDRPREHGDWYAPLDGERLPVGHSTCFDWRTRVYFDPGRGHVSKRWRRWINDVKTTGRMIIQESQRGPDFDADGYPKVHCVGYLGAFYVSDVKLHAGGMFSCRIGEQYL